METKKLYPGKANEDGFYFANAEEEEKGILTKVVDNNCIVKSVELSGGRVALVRELLAEDIMQARKIANIKEKDPDSGSKLQYALIEVSTTINGSKVFADEVKRMKAKDFSKIMELNADLNF